MSKVKKTLLSLSNLMELVPNLILGHVCTMVEYVLKVTLPTLSKSSKRNSSLLTAGEISPPAVSINLACDEAAASSHAVI